MSICFDCNQDKRYCSCLSEFFEENEELLKDLAELEASEKPGAKRCVICLNYRCSCKEGHAERLKRGG